MDTKRDPKRICTYIGLGLFAMMSIWLLGMMGLQVLFMRYAPALLYSTWGMWLLNDIPLYLLGLPLFLLILRAVPNGPAAARPTQKFGPAQFLMAVAFSLGATYLINFVTSILMMLMQYFLSGSFDSVGNALEDIVTGSSLLPNILFGTIVPALGEEFIFRYTIRKKMQGCSDKSYILFSAACFAAFHGNLSQLMYAFVIGCLFAWLYLQTGKIWVPMLLHFAINLMGIVVAPAALGNETASIILSYMVIGLIVGAVMIFVMLRKRIFATLQPPTEAGWPYTPPKQPAFAAPYGGAVPGGAAPWQRPFTPPGQGGHPYGAPPPQNPQQAPPPYGAPAPYPTPPQGPATGGAPGATGTPPGTPPPPVIWADTPYHWQQPPAGAAPQPGSAPPAYGTSPPYDTQQAPPYAPPVPGSPAQQPYPAPYAAPPAYHAPATQPQGAAAQPPKKRRIFVNVGTVLYMLAAAALTLLSLASSIGLLG